MNPLGSLNSITIGSPSNTSNIRVYVRNDSTHDDVISFDYLIGERIVMNGSTMGLDFSVNDVIFHNGMNITGYSRTSVNGNYSMPWGESEELPEVYEGLKLNLSCKYVPNSSYAVEIRLFDEGAAFRYGILEANGRTSLRVDKDLTTYRFLDDHDCFVQNAMEKPHARKKISTMGSKAMSPLTIEVSNDTIVSLHEAHVDSYCRSHLSKATGSNSVSVAMVNQVTKDIPFSTPWRTVISGTKYGEIPVNGHIHQALCPENRIGNTSWIVPGKAFRDCSLSTSGSKAIIDFCAGHSMQYVHLDAGWYGSEWSNSDPRTVSKSGLNLTEVIRYADQNGVGVIVYVNIRAFSYGVTSILDTYEDWGLSGIKLGFVDGLTKGGIDKIHDIVEEAAKRKLIVNIHDNYRPTGMSRTYPNLLTQEGVRGNEQYPTASENTYLPFTRAVAGPMDYTPKLGTSKSRTTLVHQLSIPFVLYSPLTYLFWYQNPGHVRDNAGLEAWDRLSAVWNETRWLEGNPGSNAVVARSYNETWALAGMNGPVERRLDLYPDFLDDGIEYNATIFKDINGTVQREYRRVNRSTRIGEMMLPKGGSLLILRRTDPSDICGLDRYPPWMLDLNGTELVAGKEYRMGFIVRNGWDISNNSVFPSGKDIEIDENTGDLIFKPDHNCEENFTVMVEVNLSNGASLVENITFKIDKTNSPPRIEMSRSLILTEDEPFQLLLNASDRDPWDDELKWYADTNGSFINIDLGNLTVNGIPRNGDVGESWLNLFVEDTYGSRDSINITVHVMNTNDPPEILTEPNSSVLEEAVYLLILDASDMDPGCFSPEWSMKTSAGFLEMDSENSCISGMPDDPDVGTHFVNISVHDGCGGWDHLNFTLEVNPVNDPPVIVESDLPTIQEEESFTYRIIVEDPDDERLHFYMTTNATFLRIDSETGILSGVPGVVSGGSYFVNITVRDGTGDECNVNLTLDVTGINDLPAIEGPSEIFMEEDSQFSMRYQAFDPDQPPEDPLIWSLVGPSFLTVDGLTGVITGIPVNDDVGPHIVRIGVTDNEGALVTMHITAEVQNVNDPPSITACPEGRVIVNEDEEFTFFLDASDIDPSNDDLYWMVDEGPRKMRVGNGSGRLGWIPGNDDVGDHHIRISVHDGNGGSDTGEFDLYVLNTNDPPEILVVDMPDIFEDIPFHLEMSGHDPDPGDQDLRWSIGYSSLSGLEIDPITGRIDYTPNQEQNGEQTITVILTDGSGATDSSDLYFPVISVNDPPVSLVDSMDISILEDGYHVIDLKDLFMDPDDYSLKYMVYGDDRTEADIAGSEMTVYFEENWNGHKEVRVEATDGQYTASVSINVDVIPVNDRPVSLFRISESDDEVEGLYHFTCGGDDVEDGTELAYRWTSDIDGLLGSGSKTDVILSPGNHTITIRITDKDGAFYELSYEMEVPQYEREENGNDTEEVTSTVLFLGCLMVLVLVGAGIWIVVHRKGMS